MPRAFLDLDGVLADFYGGVCRAFGVDPWPYKSFLGDWNFYVHPPLNLTTEQVAPVMGADFYAGLDLLPDANEIVARAESTFGADNVYFLTAPWDTPGCETGKRSWVKKHFPKYAKKTLIGSAKEACAQPNAILFDDSDINCDKFADPRYGGLSFLIPRPWNALFRESDIETGRMIRWPYILNGRVEPQAIQEE